jgi:hypothetical protein
MNTDAGTMQFTPDLWGYWLKKALVAQGAISATLNQTWAPPGCAQLFPSTYGSSGVCGQGLTLDQYLAVAIPWLQSQGINANFGGAVLQTSQGAIYLPSAAMAGLSGGWSV